MRYLRSSDSSWLRSKRARSYDSSRSDAVATLLAAADAARFDHVEKTARATSTSVIPDAAMPVGPAGRSALLISVCSRRRIMLHSTPPPSQSRSHVTVTPYACCCVTAPVHGVPTRAQREDRMCALRADQSLTGGR